MYKDKETIFLRKNDKYHFIDCDTINNLLTRHLNIQKWIFYKAYKDNVNILIDNFLISPYNINQFSKEFILSRKTRVYTETHKKYIIIYSLNDKNTEKEVENKIHMFNTIMRYGNLFLLQEEYPMLLEMLKSTGRKIVKTQKWKKGEHDCAQDSMIVWLDEKEDKND